MGTSNNGGYITYASYQNAFQCEKIKEKKLHSQNILIDCFLTANEQYVSYIHVMNKSIFYISKWMIYVCLLCSRLLLIIWSTF